MKPFRDLVGPATPRRVSLPPWLVRWASLGVTTGDPQIARRQQFTNIAIAVAAANALSHFLINAVYDFHGLLPVNVYNLAFAGAVSLLPALHRVGANAAALALAVLVVLGNTFVIWALGLTSDLHIYFTLAGAWVFFVGTQNLRVLALVFVLFAAALLFSLNVAPVDGFVLPEDGRLRDLLSTQAMMNTITMNAVMIFLALRGLRRAEADLEEEHARSEALLATVMPQAVAQRLKQDTGARIADRFDRLCVLFADLSGFTEAARHLPPEAVVAYLDALVRRFDALSARHGVEKIKTIGDCYMAAAGFDGRGREGAIAAGRFALALIDESAAAGALGGRRLALRVGIHCGAATAGVIGETRFSYDVWGDAVNIAARLESHGQPGRIHVSDDFRAATDGAFLFEERGRTELKGIGPLRSHFLVADAVGPSGVARAAE